MTTHERGDIEATSGRASDFYGPHVTFSIVRDRVFPAALTGRPAHVLPDSDTPHTFTFIDDFARALGTLGERDDAVGAEPPPHDRAIRETLDWYRRR